MAAAPQYGFFKAVGDSGRTYVVDFYASDVANAALNWDSGSGATSTSLTFWKAPERCVIVDAAIHTGMTDTTRMFLNADGARIGGITIRYAAHLDTSNARPALAIGLKQGTNLSAIQSA